MIEHGSMGGPYSSDLCETDYRSDCAEAGNVHANWYTIGVTA